MTLCRFILAGFIFSAKLFYGQLLSTELMTGNINVWHQHTIVAPFGESRFGFFSTGSMNAMYENKKRNEAMSQSYLTWMGGNHLKFGLGTFYATVPGFHPSAHVQFFKSGKSYAFILVPRIDLTSQPTWDVMFLAEFRPKLNDRVWLYTRFQTMMNYREKDHNRSYQHLRFGLQFKLFQFGLAANFDSYGREMIYFSNYGFFIRKDSFGK